MEENFHESPSLTYVVHEKTFTGPPIPCSPDNYCSYIRFATWFSQIPS